MPAYYRDTIRQFLNAHTRKIIGYLSHGNRLAGFSKLEGGQQDAWESQVEILRRELRKVIDENPAANDWGLLLEFSIPRRQKRIDAVVLAGHLIFVLEFKSGLSGENWASARQAEDYAFDLAYFHAQSHNRPIIPVVTAPGIPHTTTKGIVPDVRPLTTVPAEMLGHFLVTRFNEERHPTGTQITLKEWDEGAYEPVPTIIEAARALYAGMSVREITRSHAGQSDLTEVTDFLLTAVRGAQSRGEKLICFVTGVPGAGKTLVGLNLVHKKEIQGEDRPASVFMSGNGPLVDILREALAQDSGRRSKALTGKAMLGKARSKVETLIQNIHHFVQHYFEKSEDEAPYERAIVFDEAQRAWNAEQNTKKYKDQPTRWHISEPEMILKVMGRHKGWALIVALVGGGQEIHDGEAGLPEWGRTLSRYPHWRVLASPEALDGGESVAGASLFGTIVPKNTIEREPSLHLNVCVRSHQATALATWVNYVLKGKQAAAFELSKTIGKFPIVLTRDLAKAKEWLRTHAPGERRSGLVASSGATRLRAYGIETSQAIREAYSYPDWFLKPRGDIRSSYQLETVATEFEIQGLELDVVGLCWGGDFVWNAASGQWRALKLIGTEWKQASSGRAIYIQNKYRVLMTRAREGLIIWVPEGDPTDTTRNPSDMDATANFLLGCGAAIV